MYLKDFSRYGSQRKNRHVSKRFLEICKPEQNTDMYLKDFSFLSAVAW